MKLQLSFLQKLYATIYIVLFGMIIITPLLICNELRIAQNIVIGEEIVEGLLMAILLGLSLLILRFYRQETKKTKPRTKRILQLYWPSKCPTARDQISF